MRTSLVLAHLCYAMKSSPALAHRHDATLSDLALAAAHRHGATLSDLLRALACGWGGMGFNVP